MLTLTESAADRINSVHTRLGLGHNVCGYLLAIAPAGCSGSSYMIERFACTENLTNFTEVYFHGEWSLFVNNKDLALLDGMNIDYVRAGLNEGFVYSNPNEKGRCGCGSSVLL
jgi:iron-sulfur cluster assembly protein